jgi:hypothetical protein
VGKSLPPAGYFVAQSLQFADNPAETIILTISKCYNKPVDRLRREN